MSVTEDYCSFEICKMLKEKWFNEPTETMIYPDNNIVFVDTNSISRIPHQKLRNSENNIYDNGVCCPTLQVVLKWLRDTHGLVVNIAYIDFLEHGEVWSYEIIHRDTLEIKDKKYENLHTYEDATGAAIKYCLTNLI